MSKIVSFVILILFAVALLRGVQESENLYSSLLTRQKVEILYRNALAQPDALFAVERITTKMENLLYQDGFLKKKDRIWIQKKLSELKSQKTPALARLSEK